MLYAVNPIKTGLLLLEFFTFLHLKFHNLKSELSEALANVTSLLTVFIKSTHRDALLHMILKDTDIRGRSVLSLLKPHLELIVLIEDYIQARFQFGKDSGIMLRKAPFA